MDPDCPEDVCFMEDEDVLVVEVGGGPPAPGGRGGRVRVLLPEVTLSAVTEFLQLVSLSVDFTIMIYHTMLSWLFTNVTCHWFCEIVALP